MDITETLFHLRKLPDLVAEEADPLARAKLIGEILTELGEVEGALKEVRQPAVAELRAQGRTVRSLATDLGLSPARVDQITKGKRA
jgi:predicted transposase YdaD